MQNSRRNAAFLFMKEIALQRVLCSKPAMEDLTHHTDEELVRLSLTDTRFFGELVVRYEKKLGAYIYRIGNLGKEDIQDLLQDIFVKVYENLNGFDQDLKFSSWIYRIAHNETMGFFRKRRARPQGHQLILEDEDMAGLASELNLVRELEEHDDAQKLREAIQTLPRQYKEVLILKFFEHKSYDEISDILALPSGTIATRITRGKERIRSYMSSVGYVYG